MSLPRAGVAAESFRQGGTEFDAKRSVSVLAAKSYSIVVTEFLHHGQINDQGTNVLVAAKNRDLVPMRVLQLGPGDYCRLAFQTIRTQREYEIFYGGDPPGKAPPKWNSRDGLLLETRRYKHCNLNSLDSVRDAFNSSKPYGSDYVKAVSHSHNPFSPKPGPFLSRYSGVLRIPSAGKYGFITSSRDCSFLLIDGKPVVSAPGRHGPMRRARRGSRKDIRLSAGPHQFEYYHAAAGSSAVMFAAWEVNPADAKPKPAAIPPTVFRAGAVGRVPAGRVTLRSAKLAPDFLVKIDGDVPLPDNPVPLIGVMFRDNSPKAVTLRAKVHWDFGDGQTADTPNVNHVYLHPGLYTVKLSLKRSGSRPVEISNRVYVDRPVLGRKAKLHTLDQYLPVLETYDPQTLDAAALRQLVLAYEAKALALLAQKKPQPEEARKYLAKAVVAGKVAFLGESAARDGEELYKLARLVAPMARDRLAESRVAARIWHVAARKASDGQLKAECEIEAADIAANDLLSATVAKPLLEAAAAHLGKGKTGPLAARLQRVWGDYYAATGNGKAARAAYHQAEKLQGSRRRYIERTAWRGAHSRSAEEFIRTGQHARAADQLRKWQSEFPTEKIDGYLTLMQSRHWAGRKQYAQAIAQAEQLLCVNPDSSYADQLLLLAAECEQKRGRKDRALATLHSLLKDYPGSPLVPEAKKRIALLEAE